jgi:transcriptional regulator with XRE-family HTH domain
MTRERSKGSDARTRLAQHLRSLRASQAISQEELAERAGLHRTYVGSVERRERNVSIDNVERLAQALGVDLSDLLAPSPGDHPSRVNDAIDRTT